MTIGEVIRNKRIKAGIGVRELARSIDVSASTICRMELNQVDPRLSTIIKIAKKLGLSHIDFNMNNNFKGGKDYDSNNAWGRFQ